MGKKRDKMRIALLSDGAFRHAVIIVLREELRKSQETEYLVDWVEDMWATIDTLVQRFGEKDARKIIFARSALPHLFDGYISDKLLNSIVSMNLVFNIKFGERWYFMQEHGSEVARLQQQIAAQYMAAKLGLEGLNVGTGRHDFILERQERVAFLHMELRVLVGDDAMALIAETCDNLPDTATRSDILAVLRYGLGQSEKRELLGNDLQQVWKTVDMLKEHFGDEQVWKLIFAPSSSIREISSS